MNNFKLQLYGYNIVNDGQMEYSDFENMVSRLVNASHLQDHGHLLVSVKHCFRQRFITTLSLGFDMPSAHKQLIIAAKLPDKNYLRYLNFVASRSVPDAAAQLS